MTTSAEPQAHPDLSHLPEDVRLRIAVAETQGFRWLPAPPNVAYVWRDSGAWALTGPRAGVTVFGLTAKGVGIPYHGFPNYLSAPAAWGALLEKERVGLQPVGAGRPGGKWQASPDWFIWYLGDCPGRAVCLAVLAKYGVPWPQPATATQDPGGSRSGAS